MAQTLSPHNARVAFARGLLVRKGRDEAGAFAVEGATLLNEALRSGVKPQEIFVTVAARAAHPIVATLESAGVPVHTVDERTFARISGVETPGGLLAVIPLVPRTAAEVGALHGMLLVLADISDPGNAGTLMRSADAFGCAGVIFGSGGVDPYHPKVVRAAMGATFRLPVAGGDAQTVGAALRAGARPIVGLAVEGEPLRSIEWSRSTVLIVGHERRGLGPWAALCDRLAAIPMPGKAESLNAAVAGSIALFEAARAGWPQGGETL